MPLLAGRGSGSGRLPFLAHTSTRASRLGCHGFICLSRLAVSLEFLLSMDSTSCPALLLAILTKSVARFEVFGVHNSEVIVGLPQSGYYVLLFNIYSFISINEILLLLSGIQIHCIYVPFMIGKLNYQS